MKILAAAGDAGGARALTPVIRCLQANGALVECRAYAAALKIWENEKFEVSPVFPIDVNGFDKILLGTTVGSEQFELEIIRAAKKASIRCISILDFWTNYRKRFLTATDELILPDQIAVMDELARTEMIAAGFPPEILVITGQPAFDELSKYRIESDIIESNKADDKIKILYVSQPLSQLYEREELGFDEQEVLCDVVNAISDICEQQKTFLTLHLKLHPREADRAYLLPPKRSSFFEIVTVDAFADPRSAVLACDLIIGMNSILLMEACFLGRPVVSYQPNLLLPDSLPSNRHGWSKAIYRQNDLVQALAAELFDENARSERKRILTQIPQIFEATRHVTELILVK